MEDNMKPVRKRMTPVEMAKLHQQIYDDKIINGLSYVDLTIKYGYSPVWIGKIIKKVKSKLQEQQQ